jgi:nicotinamide-nucleotide amidase
MGALTEIAGSSDVVDRGFITYSNDAKIDMLGVNPKTLQDFGAVSNETALEMAQGAHDRSLANISVSITGIAGPGGSDHKPEGMVCFGIAMDNQSPRALTKQFGTIGRSNVRAAATLFALNLLLKFATNNQLPQK